MRNACGLIIPACHGFRVLCMSARVPAKPLWGHFHRPGFAGTLASSGVSACGSADCRPKPGRQTAQALGSSACSGFRVYSRVGQKPGHKSAGIPPSFRVRGALPHTPAGGRRPPCTPRAAGPWFLTSPPALPIIPPLCRGAGQVLQLPQTVYRYRRLGLAAPPTGSGCYQQKLNAKRPSPGACRRQGYASPSTKKISFWFSAYGVKFFLLRPLTPAPAAVC